MTAVRTAAAALGIAAVSFQVRHMVATGAPLFHPLGLFTIQSNAIAAASLILAPIYPRLRGPSACYLTITAVVYALVLGGLPATLAGTISWDNAVLHEVIPAFVVFDWWRSPARSGQAAWKSVAMWMLYPLAYLAYTLAAGARTGWYPYGFLNAKHIGYPAVAIVSAILTGFAIGTATLYVRRGKTKTARIAASRSW